MIPTQMRKYEFVPESGNKQNFATIITLVLAYLLTKVGYAEIWPLLFCKPAVIRTGTGSLCRILKENQGQG